MSSPVAFLSRRIPNLSLDCLPLRLNALRRELHPDRRLALEVKLVARETREEVRLTDTRVPDQDNCKPPKKRGAETPPHRPIRFPPPIRRIAGELVIPPPSTTTAAKKDGYNFCCFLCWQPLSRSKSF